MKLSLPCLAASMNGSDRARSSLSRERCPGGRSMAKDRRRNSSIRVLGMRFPRSLISIWG
ncbi:hypothetical protein NDU88_002981, partial [Pleurodeles waltl]